MFCPICGNDCREDQAFCENCGNPMHRAAPVQPVQNPYMDIPTAQHFQPEVPSKTMGIVAMILGICSILFGCCIFFLAIPMAIAAIILGGIAMKRAKDAGRSNGFALAGLICGIVGLALAVIYVLVLIAMSGGFLD